MSTKSSIKWSQEEPGKPGFHLYDDVMFDLQGVEDPPVFLQISGVQVELHTMESGGASVTMEIPRQMAIELGLLSQKPVGGDGLEHKPEVQKLMDLARKFRSAPGTGYDEAYKQLQDACYQVLIKAH